MSGSASTDFYFFLCLCSSSFPEATKKLIGDGQKGMSLWDGSCSNCIHVITKASDEKGQGKMRKGSQCFHFLKWIKESWKKRVFSLLVLFWLGHRNLAEVSWQHWLSESWWQQLFLWNQGRCRCWMIQRCIRLVMVIHKDSQSPDIAH